MSADVHAERTCHSEMSQQKSQIVDVTRDVSDVTHRKRGLRFETSQLVEFLPGKKKVDFRGSSWPDEFVRHGRRALVGLRADELKAVRIEGLCLSLLMSKNLLTQR